jgi:hypothetical protein
MFTAFDGFFYFNKCLHFFGYSAVMNLLEVSGSWTSKHQYFHKWSQAYAAVFHLRCHYVDMFHCCFRKMSRSWWNDFWNMCWIITISVENQLAYYRHFWYPWLEPSFLYISLLFDLFIYLWCKYFTLWLKYNQFVTTIKLCLTTIMLDHMMV